VAQVATKVLSLPIGIILARGLGAGGKGSLSLIQLVASTSTILFGFGMANAFSYYAARGEAHGRDAVRAALVQAFGVLVILLGIYAVAGEWLTRTLLHADEPMLLFLGLVAGAPALASGLLLSFAIGSGMVRRGTEITLSVLALQLTAYVVVALLGKLSLGVAVAIWFSAIVIEAASFVVIAWPVTARANPDPGALPLIGRAWKYGSAVWLASMLGFSALRLDMFLLGGMENTAAVGVYSVAVTFAELLWFVPSALSGVMMPKIAAEREESRELTMRLSRVLWPLMAVAALGVVAVAAPAIPILFGHEFAGAILPLALLAPGIVATSAANPAGAHLLGMGKPFYGTLAAAANVAVNVGLNLILIPRIGAAGAALASSFSYTASAVVVIFFFQRMTGAGAAEMFWPKRADFASVFEGLRAAVTRS
jgi:O-antigen/teichoic acid export membrane protein